MLLIQNFDVRHSITGYFRRILVLIWKSDPWEKFNPFVLVTFLLELTKCLFWHEGCALVGHYLKFRYFPNISYFTKFLTLKSLGNFSSNSYIPCLYLIISHRFTCPDIKIWWNIEKSQNIIKMILFKVSFCCCWFY